MMSWKDINKAAATYFKTPSSNFAGDTEDNYGHFRAEIRTTEVGGSIVFCFVPHRHQYYETRTLFYTLQKKQPSQNKKKLFIFRFPVIIQHSTVLHCV